MANCYKCAYRGTIPGDCHSRCGRKFNNINKPTIDSHGVKSGWCFFPANFDPIWLGECEGFSEEFEKDKYRDGDMISDIMEMFR